MEDCLAPIQPLRLLCDRLDRRNAALSLVVTAVRETQCVFNASLAATKLSDIEAHSLQAHRANGNER
jgi:hypothetical protein